MYLFLLLDCGINVNFPQQSRVVVDWELRAGNGVSALCLSHLSITKLCLTWCIMKVEFQLLISPVLRGFFSRDSVFSPSIKSTYAVALKSNFEVS